MRKIKYFLALTFISLGLFCFINCTDETKEETITPYPAEKTLPLIEIPDSVANIRSVEMEYDKNGVLLVLARELDGQSLIEVASDGTYSKKWKENTSGDSFVYFFDDQLITWVNNFGTVYSKGYDDTALLSVKSLQETHYPDSQSNYYINPVNNDFIFISFSLIQSVSVTIFDQYFNVKKEQLEVCDNLPIEDRTGRMNAGAKIVFFNEGDFIVVFDSREENSSDVDYKAFCRKFDINGNPLSELKRIFSSDNGWNYFEAFNQDNDIVIIATNTDSQSLDMYRYFNNNGMCYYLKQIYNSSYNFVESGGFGLNHFPDGRFLVHSQKKISSGVMEERILRFSRDGTVVEPHADIGSNYIYPGGQNDIATKEDGEFAVWWRDDNSTNSKSYISRYLF